MPNSTGRRFVAAENMWISFGQKGNINILNSTWTPTPAHFWITDRTLLLWLSTSMMGELQ